MGEGESRSRRQTHRWTRSHRSDRRIFPLALQRFRPGPSRGPVPPKRCWLAISRRIEAEDRVGVARGPARADPGVVGRVPGGSAERHHGSGGHWADSPPE